MTRKKFSKLMERAADLPESALDELADIMIDMEARYYGVYATDEDERIALKRSQDDVGAGRFASEDDVKKVFRHFHRA
jgi:hypothetical protein